MSKILNWVLMFVAAAALSFGITRWAYKVSDGVLYAPKEPKLIAMFAVWKCHTPIVILVLSDGTLHPVGNDHQLSEQEKQELQELGKTLPKKAQATMFIACSPQEEEEFQEKSGGDVDAQSTHKYGTHKPGGPGSVNS